MAINWIPITSEAQIGAIAKKSSEIPCVIFKHSTTCSISTMAKSRLEKNWDFSDTEIQAYYLDLLNYRPISKEIAVHFDVHHESPQILLIKDGECTYDASHLDITVDELRSCFSDSN